MHARILTSEAFRLKASEYKDSSSNSRSVFSDWTRLNSFVSELDGIVPISRLEVPISSLEVPISSLDSSLEPGVAAWELLELDDPERVKISSRLSSKSWFEPCGRLIPSQPSRLPCGVHIPWECTVDDLGLKAIPCGGSIMDIGKDIGRDIGICAADAAAAAARARLALKYRRTSKAGYKRSTSWHWPS